MDNIDINSSVLEEKLPENLGYNIPVIEKKTLHFSHLESVTSIIVFALGFLYARFVFCETTGFFTTLVFALITVTSMIFLKKSGKTLGRFQLICIALLLVFSTVYSITANWFIKFLATTFLMLLGTYFAYSTGIGAKGFGRYLPFELGKSFFTHPFGSMSMELAALGYSTRRSKLGANALKIFLGLLLAVPLTVVVGNLLMSADSGVQKMLSDIVEAVFSQNVWAIIFQLVVAVPIACYIFGMLYSATHNENEKALSDEACEGSIARKKCISNVIIYTAVTPICILYVMFFVSQLSYFTSAFAGLLPTDYSYSEYARNGFFELFAIELINIGVIGFINLFSKESGRQKPVLLKLYSVTISVFTLIIIATAVSKMVMYMDEYGLTQLRLYTTWFMALTAIVFVFIIIKQFKFDFKFAQATAIAFIAMFAVLCFSRPDAIIAKYNLTYKSEGMTQYELMELANLSDDALAVILSDDFDDTLTNILGDEKEHFISSFEHKCDNEEHTHVYDRFNLSGLKIWEKFK